jgi:glycosyltransferase involved in cell wall biosynthesis
MAHEVSQFPPLGVVFSFLRPRPPSFRVLRSPLKGQFHRVDAGDNDLIEAVLTPVFTKDRWVYSLECFQAPTAFSLLGCPLPRSVRAAWVKRLLLRENCKKLVFWSQVGMGTLRTYAGIDDKRLLKKAAVVYPAVRVVPDDLIRYNDGDVTVLFSGDFFRKGGVNVVDAFERAQRLYPSITLRLCCDERMDFNTRNAALREEYLHRIRRNDRILVDRIPRDELVHHVLPRTDIYLLPTYAEAFGFAILEAMAFGIPVISTNHFAIPEMVQHGVSGFLIDTSRFDADRLFRGYRVDAIPPRFREYVTDQLFTYLCQLIESPELRRKLGTAGLGVARTKFSFESRNEKMLAIYQEALR